MRTEWREMAACRGADPAIFFVGKGQSIAEPMSYCNRCEVREDCLAFAMSCDVSLEGIFGGTSRRQRDRLRGYHVSRAS